ncbi:MAG: reverse transcriptase domain-containing protein [Planctomycetota bacterium]|jgi:group II intron reverse transcriptase/maturase
MRAAETVLSIIRERGQRGLPLERLYRQLYNPSLYLCAYGKLYANKGAMTPGVTPETVDGMSLTKIGNIIKALRQERYRWTPVRRTYIPKSNGKRRGLGMPTWSDKLLQEVIRQLLEAYYEPQFSIHSHGFRPGRGCHTALQEITRHWRGVKWFIEGDIRACFDRMDHTILLGILRENIHDNRFIRLIDNLVRAGYLEEWNYNTTYSGVPQGGVVSPILSNLVLDRLDKFVEQTLIPAYTSGLRRKTNPPYVALTKAAWQARKTGDLDAARRFSQQAQTMPSREPNDPNFRRLWYCRYADDFLLGFAGPKAEAEEIKRQLAAFLRNELKLELSEEKTLITHARTKTAQFLGYEIHTLHADDKHDYRGQRCINGGIGLQVPARVIQAQCAKYMRRGKPIHFMQRVNDNAYSIVAQYQAEYRGVVQYYRLAYNLHRLSQLKWVAETSLVKTLAKKYRTSRNKIYRRFRALHQNEYGIYKVLEVTVDRGPDKTPLVARFGGIPLRWNKWVAVNDRITTPIWSKRSEVVERLLAQKCELCGAEDNIEVHHIRKLADLERKGQADKRKWVKVMAARRRKSLVICQRCHNDIHYGRYDGSALSK